MTTAPSPAPAAPAQAPAASPSAGGGAPGGGPQAQGGPAQSAVIIETRRESPIRAPEPQRAPQSPQRDPAIEQQRQQQPSKGFFGTLVDATKAAVKDALGIGNGQDPQYYQAAGKGQSSGSGRGGQGQGGGAQGAYQPSGPVQSAARENSQAPASPSPSRSAGRSPNVMQTYTTQDKDGNFQVFHADSGKRVAPGLENQIIDSVKRDIASGKLEKDFGRVPEQPAKGQEGAKGQEPTKGQEPAKSQGAGQAATKGQEPRAAGSMDSMSPAARAAAVSAVSGISAAGGTHQGASASGPTQAPSTPAPAASAQKTQSAGASR